MFNGLYVYKESVMELQVSRWSIWVIIAMSVKRPLQRKSFSMDESIALTMHIYKFCAQK